ncbi:MAG: recombination regulator RecX [Burkholderiaceae bacterium]|nr:recombination regulator RecX [Burkholderiaceae bacterium]MDH3459427.1 recombination regulator RecX [Burkholderiaceae bacterium]
MPPPTLKARAVQWLAQREHSRSELRRKLLRHARAGNDDPAGAAEQVNALLDWLEEHHYLSQDRFVQSRVHVRAARYGNLRIQRELAQHGLKLPPDAAQALKDSELARARAVWSRKFDAPAGDAAARAKQMRFLAARGFTAELIRQVVCGGNDDD